MLAVLDGEFTLKRYRRRGDGLWLEAENAFYPPTEDERAQRVRNLGRGQEIDSHALGARP